MNTNGDIKKILQNNIYHLYNAVVELKRASEIYLASDFSPEGTEEEIYAVFREIADACHAAADQVGKSLNQLPTPHTSATSSNPPAASV